MKLGKRLKLALISLTATACVGGVYASWQYQKSPTPAEAPLSVGIKDFYWAPEEILPDYESIGESHLDLLNSIVNDRSNGLNNQSSPLNGEIKNRIQENKNTVGSMAVVQGGNLKHLFTTSATEALEFVIEFVSDTEYFIYTFEDDELNKTGKEGAIIPVFQSYCKKTDGVWEIIGSRSGTATTKYYDSNKGGKRLSIDVTTWVKKTTA